MDKDKKIQLLETRVTKLEKLINVLHTQLTLTSGRVVRTDESLRRMNGDVQNLKRRR